MSNALAVQENSVLEKADPIQKSTLEKVLIQGDLSGLKPDERMQYYRSVCDSIGLNPLTRPFEYIELNGKLTLYAKKDTTDQLRKINGISIVNLEAKQYDGVYVVTAYARTRDGREDRATGAVSIERENGDWQTSSSGKRYFKGNGSYSPLRGEELANAFLKAETKAKRRVTLSICGLGWLDETEVESIPSARHVDAEVLEPVTRSEPPKSKPKSNPRLEWLKSVTGYEGKQILEIVAKLTDVELKRGNKYRADFSDQEINQIRDAVFVQWSLDKGFYPDVTTAFNDLYALDGDGAMLDGDLWIDWQECRVAAQVEVEVVEQLQGAL